jgi:hypothetical protein
MLLVRLLLAFLFRRLSMQRFGLHKNGAMVSRLLSDLPAWYWFSGRDGVEQDGPALVLVELTPVST